MITSLKLEQETKERLLNLDLAEKGKSFNIILNELISFYERNNGDHTQRVKDYDKQMKEYQKSVKLHEKQVQSFEKEQETWEKLLKWAKSQGFKG